MKKHLFIMLAMVLALFTLVACGNSNNDSESSSNVNNSGGFANESDDSGNNDHNQVSGTTEGAETGTSGNIGIDSNARGNSSGNLFTGGRFALYDNRIFFSNPDSADTALSLYSMNIDGSDITQISRISQAAYINIIGGRVYLRTGGNRGSLISIHPDGTDRQTLINDGIIGRVTVVGDNVYFQRLDRLYSVNLDGSDMQRIVESASNTNIIGNRVLFSAPLTVDGVTADNATIYSMNIDGTGEQRIGDAADNIIACNDWLYVQTGRQDDTGWYTVFYRMRHDGSGKEELAYFAISVQYMFVHGDRIFFTDTARRSGGETFGGRVHSIRIDGTDFQVLTDFPTNSMAILGERIYFIGIDDDNGGARSGVYSMRLDGTDIRKYL